MVISLVCWSVKHLHTSNAAYSFHSRTKCAVMPRYNHWPLDHRSIIMQTLSTFLNFCLRELKSSLILFFCLELGSGYLPYGGDPGSKDCLPWKMIPGHRQHVEQKHRWTPVVRAHLSHISSQHWRTFTPLADRGQRPLVRLCTHQDVTPESQQKKNIY